MLNTFRHVGSKKFYATISYPNDDLSWDLLNFGIFARKRMPDFPKKMEYDGKILIQESFKYNFVHSNYFSFKTHQNHQAKISNFDGL